MLVIRPESTSDIVAIRAVHEAAFPTPAEADLVDRLRAGGNARVSLIAKLDGVLVGHVLFSPVTIAADGGGEVHGLGLAPLAVLPQQQRRGIGAQLVVAGLHACRRQQQPFVVVLGYPRYYPRFGFERASLRGIRNEYAADEAYMVIELSPGGLPVAGLAKYGPEFALFG